MLLYVKKLGSLPQRQLFGHQTGAGILQTEKFSLLNGHPFDEPHRDSILPALFKESRPIIAKWYLGALIVPEGDMTNYVHIREVFFVFALSDPTDCKRIVIEHLSVTTEQCDFYKIINFRPVKKQSVLKIKVCRELVNDVEK